MLKASLLESMHRRSGGSVERRIRDLWKERMIEEVTAKTWKLTQPGYLAASKVLATLTGG